VLDAYVADELERVPQVLLPLAADPTALERRRQAVLGVDRVDPGRQRVDTRQTCSPPRISTKLRKKPSGGWWVSALAAMWARKMLLPRVSSSTCSRNSWNSPSSPWMQRRSKNTQVSISALGSGWLTHLSKYPFQVASGCRHSSVMAIISPGQ
jgi:hypothetical protein